jgi:hypothetical protein
MTILFKAGAVAAETLAEIETEFVIVVERPERKRMSPGDPAFADLR